MDQSSLSLKILKNHKKKKHSIMLKECRKLKKILQKKGQVFMEGLFFITLIFSFLLGVQFFQSLARKEIQKERLTKQKIDKPTQASWFRSIQNKK